MVLLGFGTPSLGQDAPAATQDAEGVEEVLVPGRRPENLWVEIERLETAVYERFNALNSNDELDIRCLEQAPTGSNIPARRCAPNFVIRAEGNAATKAVTDVRGTGSNKVNPAEQAQLMEAKSRELTEEMQRLAREDEQLLRDLVRLDELRQLQASRDSRRSQR
jgi:hypothetical protein